MTRCSLAFLIVTCVSASSSALAQNLDGRWSGKIANGASIEIVVSSDKAQSYTFRGRSIDIWNSRSSGNSITFTAGNIGTVVLTKIDGKTLGYAYSDTRGGAAQATLAIVKP